MYIPFLHMVFEPVNDMQFWDMGYDFQTLQDLKPQSLLASGVEHRGFVESAVGRWTEPTLDAKDGKVHPELVVTFPDLGS